MEWFVVPLSGEPPPNENQLSVLFRGQFEPRVSLSLKPSAY